MIPSADICWRAFAAKDARFDGIFFTGVKSTGIYCRPVCPARAARAVSCEFYETAAGAEQAGFRPCLRCRPELAPGRAPDGSPGQALFRLLQTAALEGTSVESVAGTSGYSERQLRRLVIDTCGVAPVEIMQTQRLLFAKNLLHETRLSVSEIALAAGFGSLRRFNALIRERYGLPPTALRAMASGRPAGRDSALTLRAVFRPPLAWGELLGYLQRRAIPGVEHVTDGEYARTVRFGQTTGIVRVRKADDENALLVEIPPALIGRVGGILRKVRELFDLEARPDVIEGHLGTDRALRPLLATQRGLRVLGAWDMFELAVRTVLGQQVSVAGATTLAGRLARRFGEALSSEPPTPGLERLSPTPESLARAPLPALIALGLPKARAATVQTLARFALDGGFDFRPGTTLAQFSARLEALPGIGPWTANYLGMRALRFPDAFPAGDLGLRKALVPGTLLAEKELLRRAEPWRPWRAYAAAHLWFSLPPAGGISDR